jgi:hypothetical protein
VLRFGEVLRASPPRRVREIAIQKVNTNVVQPLFHGEGSTTMSPAKSVQAKSAPFQQGSQATRVRDGIQTGQDHGNGMLEEEKLTNMTKLTKGVQD